MSILISAHLISKRFSSRPLFENITFSVNSGERIGLIGPNGAGKSTLLKILAGLSPVDAGTISMQKGLKVAFLEQVPEFQESSTVLSSVMEGANDPDDWEEMARAQELISKLGLNSQDNIQEDTLISSLSGGWKKRVAITREIMKEPDLLLLDEPTNHLDIESILILENYISESKFSTITITHDRLFLQRVSNRILELDPRHKNGLISVNGDYATYLKVREQLLSDQEILETKLKNTLRRETEWLQRGPKARLTKQQARIDQAEKLKEEVSELSQRNITKTAKIDFVNTEKNPKKLIEAIEISKSYEGSIVIPPIDLLITPKTRLGLIGSNGCGKSTLIKLLIGEIESDSGSVNLAENLQIAYFEQNRESLNQELSLIKTLCPDGDNVDFAGNKVHIKTYLKRFLFSYDQMDMPVGKLSGGEQSRLLLAQIMLKPMNLLVLDEPTNDLDMATLDVLEDVLQEFKGAVILVSHDRYFLDNVSNQFIAFGIDEEGKKELTFLSGLDQWEKWQERQSTLKEKLIQAELVASKKAIKEDKASKHEKKKLSYKDQRELDSIEKVIQAAEEEVELLTKESLLPEVASSSEKLIEITNKLSAAQIKVEELYARWAQLSE